MLQDYVTPLPLLLLLAVHCACLAALAAALLVRPFHDPGWRVVAPSGTHWFAFIGCWVFSALVSWVWLFIGSGRSDAEFQMRMALVLVAAFGLCAAWCGFMIVWLRRKGVRWNGTAIRWRERGRDIFQDMLDVDTYRRALSGALHVRFRDGTVLKLDLHCRDADVLALAILIRADLPVE